MDLSPPSLIRSPSSSRNSNYSRSPSLSVDYSPPDLVDHFYKVGSVYEQSCSAISSTMNSDSPHHQRLDATTSAEWAETTVIHSVPSMVGQGIVSQDYVPYVSYDSSMHTPYSHDLYSTHLAHAPALSYAPSPLASMPSRSPDPASSRHPLPYHSTPPMPRIKLEGGHDYSSGGEVSQYPSPRSAHALMAEPSSYGSQACSSGYLSDGPSSSWPKSEYPPIEGDPYYVGPSGSTSSLVPDRRHQAPPRPSRAPKRQARKLTSKDEANFQCEVEGCGKLFSRSYNYKAHMETHDKKREYPFVCTYEDCNKKFVRKTDLQRHHQSVHMKEKNHKCDYCGRHFARKDTLRRHMEDGCSKRFDIGTVDIRGAESYDTYNVPIRSVPSSSGHMVAPTPHLPPMTLPRGGNDSGMTDMPSFMRR
ncbi:hypothetical protein F5B22DRAFT_71228 [Xylaria bambusicola]|uniref:uncharacterized protein n=1 Tax=Xylaria bambusicola TaxID=326684 RepID=UPI002007B0F2|nr:uncharacterized protein F5B22DRAFT_71228 [Xylaria bambusicola]KAI0518570.1 hypothetical protein F5B22DRAFT_71228 [Xylaria bambusicola]